jgi:surface protein
LELNIQITATPESYSEEKLVQNAEVKIKTALPVKLENTKLSYAWKIIDETDPDAEPESDEYIEETSLTGTNREKSIDIFSDKTIGGAYNLWIKVEVNEISKTVHFGEYIIQDHTTLLSTASENSANSHFLGMDIERQKIKKIIIKNVKTHSVDNRFYFDVSESGRGAYIGSYDLDEDDGYYTVTLEGTGGIVANSNSKNLFAYIGSAVESGVKIIGLDYLDTSSVTSMSYMFYNSAVENLDLSEWNTENVTNLYATFISCTKLQTIDVSGWDTSNVTNMQNAFNSCRSLTSLNLSSLNTSKVTNMSYMFSNCTGLTELNLSNLDTSKVTNMSYMFRNCNSLTELSLSSFNTSKLTDMSYMFYGCTGLTSITGLSGLDTSKVTNMSYMFYGCTGLTSITGLSGLDTSKVTNMSYMFCGCTGLTSITGLSGLNASKVTNMSYMFRGCTGLTSINLSDLDTSKVTNMSSMFEECTGLTSINLSDLDTSKVTNMSSMFEECTGLTSIDLSGLNTSSVTDMSYMFSNCTGLTSITGLSSLDTSSVKKVNGMFYGCKKIITTVTIKADTLNSYGGMFYNAASVTGAKIKVNYTSANSDLVDIIIKTKGHDSNVVKGDCVD